MGGLFDLDKKKKEIAAFEAESSQAGFWNDSSRARGVMGKLTALKKSVQLFERLERELSDLDALSQLAKEENDEGILSEINAGTEKLKAEILELETETKLSGEHDRSDAIVSIHAGAGGTESCDWADMLFRLYARWAEKKRFALDIIDFLPGDETGIKSITFIVKGEYAYGHLQSEVGVHRLVRISPFDANKRRHTSFSSVDVIPEIEEDTDVKVEEKDIRVDTYRASGHGGQYLNKTDSAVRITHVPSGIVVQSQKERSQLKNRITAMKLLKARLYELEQEKLRQSIEKHYDEKGAIAWGNQIRSYVFMPYQLVKDHRTGAEVPQVNLVMDGEIDPFITAYLDWKLAGKKKVSTNVPE